MKTRILSQGMLDGACLLYAIVNAKKALTHPNHLTHTFIAQTSLRARWKELISIVGSPHKYLNGDGSDYSLRSNTEPQIICSIITNAFLIFGGPHQFTVRHIDLNEMHQIDYADQVVIFCIQPPIDHWLVAVGKTKKSPPSSL